MVWSRPELQPWSAEPVAYLTEWIPARISYDAASVALLVYDLARTTSGVGSVYERTMD